MESKNYFNELLNMVSSKFHVYFILINCLLFYNNVNAGSHFYKTRKYIAVEKRLADTEKKVDYIESIYFSGKNKDGLTTMILTTYQSLEGKPATTAVAKQYVFLTGITEKANAAKNSCEVEELLAAGIWNIDANEAILQNIPKPGKAAADDAGDAITKVASLSSSTSNLAGSVALSTWNLSGGSYSAYGAYSGMSRVGGTLSSVSGAANTVSQGKQVADQVSKYFHKDKPCNNVPQKNIEIGSHMLPDTNKIRQSAGTKVIIKNIKYDQITLVASIIQKINGVTSVNSDDFNNNTATMLVAVNMKVKELVDKILQSNNGYNFNVESISTNSNTATLSIK